MNEAYLTHVCEGLAGMAMMTSPHWLLAVWALRYF